MRKKRENVKTDYIVIRVTPEEKAQIQADANEAGLDNICAYLLQLYRRSKK